MLGIIVVTPTGTSAVGVSEVSSNLTGVSPSNAAVVVLRNSVVMAGEAVVVVYSGFGEGFVDDATTKVISIGVSPSKIGVDVDVLCKSVVMAGESVDVLDNGFTDPVDRKK